MRRTIGKAWVGLAAIFATLALSGQASAQTLDLTSVGASGTINGALFQQAAPQPTGTGFIDSFLRLQNKGMEQGYNTDARPVQFDEKKDATFTHSLLLSDVPIVNINGTNYRQFLLDTNEENSAKGRYLSLDGLQIFQSPVGNLNNFPNLGDKIYDLGNNSVLLDDNLNHGSGSGDMFLNIPDSFFTSSNPYVTLYSHFGDADGTSDGGFEEGAVLKGSSTPPVNPVPAPATLVFAGLASALGLVGYARRRGKEKPAVTPAS